MRIYIESLLLASSDPADGCAGPDGLSLNGRHLVEENDYVRSEQVEYVSREGFGTTLQFSTRYLFETLEAAVAFYFGHWRSVPKSGTVQCIIGSGESALAFTLQGAVLELSEPTLHGCTVVVQYTLRGGLFEPTEVAIPEAEELELIKRGNVALTAGDTEKAVDFGTPFGVAPGYVRAEIVPDSGVPGAARFIECTPLHDTITAEGFDVIFAAELPAGGTYRLYWTATL